MPTAYELKIDMEGGGAVDVHIDVSDSTITFSELPEQMPTEDYDAINRFMTECTRLMANPRMLKAEVTREDD